MGLGFVVVALTRMIDGFWIQYVIAPNRLNPKAAIQAYLAYLSSFSRFQGNDDPDPRLGLGMYSKS